MRDYKSMEVWQYANSLTSSIYRTTAYFPRYELCGLTRKIRRACSSIPDKIAEGCSKKSDAEMGKLLQTALGSAEDVENHLLLAHNLGYLEDSKHTSLTGEIVHLKEMLASFMMDLRTENR